METREEETGLGWVWAGRVGLWVKMMIRLRKDQEEEKALVVLRLRDGGRREGLRCLFERWWWWELEVRKKQPRWRRRREMKVLKNERKLAIIVGD